MTPKIAKYSKALKDAEKQSHADVRLEITLETKFDRLGHDEPWKNNLANDLNLLLHYARVSKPSFIPLALSLAARIAEFEEIGFV